MNEIKSGRWYQLDGDELTDLSHSPIVNQLNRGLEAARVRYPEQGARYERAWIKVGGEARRIDRVVIVKAAARSGAEPGLTVKLRGVKEEFNRGIQASQNERQRRLGRHTA